MPSYQTGAGKEFHGVLIFDFPGAARDVGEVVLGIFADFVQIKRPALFGSGLSDGAHGTLAKPTTRPASPETTPEGTASSQDDAHNGQSKLL
jgi:hypothetical protein